MNAENIAIPAGIVANVRGLSPARAAVARALSWRDHVDADLARLRAGRTELAERIADAESAERQHEAAVDAEAESLVSSIRKGVAWTLALAKPRAEPIVDLSAARAALAKLDAEIDAKSAALVTVGEAIAEAVHAVVTEEATEIARAYERALSDARDAATKLEAVEIFLGRGRAGRVVFDAPGFRVAGDEIDIRPVASPPGEIRESIGVWRAFADAVSSNPRAKTSQFLRFRPHDDAAPQVDSYHELTAAERRAVDLRYASEK